MFSIINPPAVYTPTISFAPVISIQPLESCHAPAVLHMMNDDICRYLGRRPCENLQQAIRYVYEYDGTQPIRFAITHKDAGFVGVISFGLLAAEPLEVIIGYWIAQEFQKCGYASRAIKLLLAVLKDIQVYRVRAEVFPGNIKSIRLLEKLGFFCEDKSKLPNGQLQYQLILN